MKLTLRDFFVFFIGVLITAISGYFILKSKAPKFDPSKLRSNNTSRIKWKSQGDRDNNAEDLISDFNKHNEFNSVLRVRYKKPNSNDSTDGPMKGFLFNAADIYEIIADNKSGIVPTDILFYFGSYRDADEGKGKKHARIRMIAVGVNGKQLLNFSSANPLTAGDEISCFDKADPCPPNGPDGAPIVVDIDTTKTDTGKIIKKPK